MSGKAEKNEFFEGIKAGLEDAIDYAKGDTSRARAHQPRVPHEVDVKAIRKRTGLTQAEFAKAFGITIDTLRQWEQGRRTPRGPSRALLVVIEREPEAVLRALGVGEDGNRTRARG